MAHRYDESRWPVVYSWAIGESRAEDVQEYIEVCERALKRRERHVVIMDASEGQNMRAEHRRLVSQWVQDHKEELATYRAGLGFVFKSAVIRGMLVATYWLFPPPYAYKTFDSLEDATAWAEELLRGTAPSGKS
jgi:hypothetical protein